ncbi:glutamine--tRNA ligase/YqeY domain fusion protein [Marinithermus hydrothermalis]|uniref:Glutamine--tRNA ligase n=1 Tax=Marinithermus hydrothermalis (strain DSM 14884 / JCM 11576 / T1) TaxID=869210 RepID=F2NKB2_MARHT|nr:glutamine--tRNA ligase/YqeY domain fusion protein [Marinithermus hydrothermalis]AEB12361.1 Glutaminyl-tRNA synthetase [Marinithermus hydrothermalis DSM 14884]
MSAEKEHTTPKKDEHRHVSPNFITEIIDEDLRQGRYKKIVTRFPPEPNGYLHIGHAKSICLNFGIALDYGGECNLRFDDTNPETENEEYVEAIKRDVEWLGFKWAKECYASDYFEKLYECAVELIKAGKAYVDSLSEEEMRAYRGTVDTPGRPSPYRDRSVEENLELFERMRRGEFPNGAHVLRAKIDLASPNMKLRDPVLYRIVHAPHYRTGDRWCIYPMYDFAHPLSDFIEGVTHSLCTLEFENNRAIYDWLVENLKGKCGLPQSPRPHQYEFARLNMDYTVLSKRKLIRLVEGGYVQGWDDPRMPTISGLRRRGVTPEAIRDFANRIGVAKANSRVDIRIFEAAIRDDLNHRAPRVLAVLRPLKVVITNYPEDQEEWLEAPYWPHDVPKEGTRKLPFSRELFIERDDFMEDPPKGFRRLTPGGRVRLRHAYVIRCDEVVKNARGEVVELRCTYDPDTLGKNPADGPVKGTIHWVSARHAIRAEMRLYDRLFTVPNPEEGGEDFTRHINPDSLVVVEGYVEPSVRHDPPDTRYQFERLGYFWQDPADSSPERLVFNRIVTLRDARTKPTPRPAKPQPKPAPAPPKEQPALTPEQQAALERFKRQGIGKAEALVLAREPKLAAYLEAAGRHASPAALASWVVHELGPAIRADAVRVTPEQLAELVRLLEEGTIHTRIAKSVLAEAQASGEAPAAIVEKKGLRQLADEAALEPVVDRVLAAYPDKVEAFRKGKTGLMGFFVGQVMRATEGRANPRVVQALVARKLGG